MEARVGIEPTHKGFADLSLTTWVPRLETYILHHQGAGKTGLRMKVYRNVEGNLERETGVEPATSSLARKHSTTELLPLCSCKYIGVLGFGKGSDQGVRSKE